MTEMEEKIFKIKHETRGALEQTLTFVEESSKNSDGQLV